MHLVSESQLHFKLLGQHFPNVFTGGPVLGNKLLVELYPPKRRVEAFIPGTCEYYLFWKYDLFSWNNVKIRTYSGRVAQTQYDCACTASIHRENACEREHPLVASASHRMPRMAGNARAKEKACNRLSLLPSKGTCSCQHLGFELPTSKTTKI